MNKELTDADFERAAAALGCHIAAVQAVCTVEAPRGGFLPDGRPVILFEAHIFSRLTGHIYDYTYPAISSRAWNRALYGGGITEHSRLALAAELDRPAALQSASWGRFQIMGFNYRRAGWPTLEGFVGAMHLNEGAQLDAFVAYVKAAGLDDELRRQDWEGFARGYNGAGFAANQYDTKLAVAFRSYAPMPGPGRVV